MEKHKLGWGETLPLDKSTHDLHDSYQQMVKTATPKPKCVQNTTLAFLAGGTICAIGQLVYNLFDKVEPSRLETSAATLATIIALGAIATGLGVYDWLAERAGMGMAVPISGFSNTVTAAAMEFKQEGYLLGMGAKMFVIAGPVLVYGILSGFVISLLRAIFTGMLF
jgi:stage V sporulation protein AC